MSNNKSKLEQRLTMPGQIHKAKKVLLKLLNPKIIRSDQAIPLSIIQRAKGVAFITVVKAGFIFSGTLGSGIVIAKLDDGTWSGPSSLGVGGMGWGALIGASVTDSVIVLNTDAAVLAFSGQGQVQFGGNLSIAAGPVGREADASARIGSNAGVAACYSYSHSRGVFAGISLQGSILITRDSDNARFYGCPVKAKEILNGRVTPPEFQDLIDLQKSLSAIMLLKETLSRVHDISSSSLTRAQENVSDDSDYDDGGVGDEQLESLSGAANMNEQPLPPGWMKLETGQGQSYYYHTDSQKTQWERPRPVSLPKGPSTMVPIPPRTISSPQESTHVIPPARTTSLERKQPPPRTNSLRMGNGIQSSFAGDGMKSNPFDGFSS